MTILERYLQREILSRLGWILVFLVLILASDKFVDYLADAAAGNLPNDLIFNILAMKMMSLLPRLLPVALFLGVILALSRMSQDRELTIVSGAGVAEYFKIFSIFKFSLMFAVLVFITSFYLSPWAEKNVREISYRAAIESDITGISSGKFKEFSKGDTVVYVEDMDNKKQQMRNVFLQVRQDDELGVLNSSGARFVTRPETGSRYVLFENGSRYTGQPGARDYQITRYRTYAVILKTGDDDPGERRMETLPSSELWQDPRPHYKAELQWRMSFVFATLLLPVFALGVNRYTGVDSRYVPIFICILAYLIYSNLLGLSRTLLEWDRIPGYIGLWWVHLCLLITVLLLIVFPHLSRWLRSLRARSAG
jgi:lipopolysaccharide export system permease protein